MTCSSSESSPRRVPSSCSSMRSRWKASVLTAASAMVSEASMPGRFFFVVGLGRVRRRCRDGAAHLPREPRRPGAAPVDACTLGAVPRRPVAHAARGEAGARGGGRGATSPSSSARSATARRASGAVPAAMRLVQGAFVGRAAAGRGAPAADSAASVDLQRARELGARLRCETGLAGERRGQSLEIVVAASARSSTSTSNQRRARRRRATRTSSRLSSATSRSPSYTRRATRSCSRKRNGLQRRPAGHALHALAQLAVRPLGRRHVGGRPAPRAPRGAARRRRR